LFSVCAASPSMRNTTLSTPRVSGMFWSMKEMWFVPTTAMLMTAPGCRGPTSWWFLASSNTTDPKFGLGDNVGAPDGSEVGVLVGGLVGL